MENIRNIIFDLGGVILDIDFKRTNVAFQLLGLENFHHHISQHHITDFFEEYETGKINDDDFVGRIGKLFDKPVGREDIVAAWNAILLDFSPERIQLLQRIKPKYRTFLLSNTNSLHQKEFQKRLHDMFGVYLEDLFEKAYYSHSLQLRKPNADIFEFVLNDSQLEPAQTLFIDDTASNFPEAEKLGIRTYHLRPPETINDLPLFAAE